MEEKKTNKKKKFILLGLGVAATGLLSYFGWQYWANRKKNKEEEEENSTSQLAPQKSAFIPSFFTPKESRNDEFPLKKGSKGANVKVLQEALMEKYGKEILPRYGADGDFGNEMAAALAKKNLPDTIDENTYNVLVKASGIEATPLAKTLYKDAVNKNISGVIASLKKIRNKEDYSAVSIEFKKYSLRGVSQTLVNGLLGSFSEEEQKQQIRLEFSRMGLKYDGNKWSLSGLEGFTLITTEPAKVWRTLREGANVPAKMILGTEVAERDGYTLFESGGKKFIVKTSSIKYL